MQAYHTLHAIAFEYLPGRYFLAYLYDPRSIHYDKDQKCFGMSRLCQLLLRREEKQKNRMKQKKK